MYVCLFVPVGGEWLVLCVHCEQLDNGARGNLLQWESAGVTLASHVSSKHCSSALLEAQEAPGHSMPCFTALLCS